MAQELSRIDNLSIGQLNAKYVQRAIMMGGPLGQVQEFYALIVPVDTKTRLEIELSGSLENHVLNPVFLRPSHTISLDEAVEHILSGELRTPIVFKPNFSDKGEGIYFIFRNEEGDYEIIVRSPERGLQEQRLPGVLKYIKDKLDFSDEGNVFRAVINGDAIKALMRDLMLYGCVTEVPYVDCENQDRTGRYDPGLIESFIDAWKFQGLAYETRHLVEGNLSQKCGFKVTDCGARIGGSSYFANLMLTRNRDKIKSLPPHEMYSPLFSELINPSQEKSFRSFTRETLERSFLYYAERLLNEGFVFESDEPCEIQFDLVWTVPSTERVLPFPAMTECGLRYFGPITFVGNKH